MTIITKSISMNRQWLEILNHPVLRREDHYILRLLAVISGYMLRPIQLKQKKKYEELRKTLRDARRYANISRDHLCRVINNDDLFLAIKSEWEWMPLFHIFESAVTTPEDIRKQLNLELLNTERLLLIYDTIKKRLGGAGRKGDDALSFIIRFLNYLFYFRTGQPVSQRDGDICLVCLLYKEAAHVHMSPNTAREKIREMNKKWNVNEVKSWVAEGNNLLSDTYMALYFATSKKLKVPPQGLVELVQATSNDRPASR